MKVPSVNEQQLVDVVAYEKVRLSRKEFLGAAHKDHSAANDFTGRR